MDLNDYKLYALQQAAARASAPQTQGGNGLDQILGQQQQPQVTSPNVTEPKPGPIRSFLSNFLYGAGQGMLSKVGLETDAQKEQRQIQQQVAQQNAQTNELYRQAYAKQAEAQNQLTDIGTFGIPGLTGMVPQKDVARVVGQHVANLGKQNVAETNAAGRKTAAEIAADASITNTNTKYGPGKNGEPGGVLTHGFKDVGGRAVMYDKRTGEIVKDMGTANSTTNIPLRARANAQYGITQSVDEEGNPISVSRLSAIQNGNPIVSYKNAMETSSGKAGLTQYEETLNSKIKPNLNVLEDTGQRAIIAHAVSQAEKNPGAIQSVINASIQDGLSPQGAQLLAGTLQARELAASLRKFGVNLNGTEGLYSRMAANQVSPGNNLAVNQQLLNNDIEFMTKAKNVLGGLTKRGVKTQPAQPSTPPASPAATHRFNPATGKIEVIK